MTLEGAKKLLINLQVWSWNVSWHSWRNRQALFTFHFHNENHLAEGEKKKRSSHMTFFFF